MPALSTWQYRTISGAASTILLSINGGAVLGGVWISSKGATGTLTAYDTASATPTLRKFIASTASLGKGRTLIEAEVGTGLAVKVASLTGCIFWRPGQAGGV